MNKKILLINVILTFLWTAINAQSLSSKQKILNQIDKEIANYEQQLDPNSPQQQELKKHNAPKKAVESMYSELKKYINYLKRVKARAIKIDEKLFTKNYAQFLYGEIKNKKIFLNQENIIKEHFLILGPEAIPTFKELIKTGNNHQKSQIIYVMGNLRDERAYPIVKEYINSPDKDICRAAVYALAEINNSKSSSDLSEFIETQKDMELKKYALEQLKRIDLKTYRKHLIKLIAYKEIEFRNLCGEKIAEDLVDPYLDRLLSLYPAYIQGQNMCFFDIVFDLKERENLLKTQKFLTEFIEIYYEPKTPRNMYGRKIKTSKVTSNFSNFNIEKYLQSLKEKFTTGDWQNWLKKYPPKSTTAIFIKDILVKNKAIKDNGLKNLKVEVQLFDQKEKLLDKNSSAIEINKDFDFQLKTSTRLNYTVKGQLLWESKNLQYKFHWLSFQPFSDNLKHSNQAHISDSQKNHSQHVKKYAGAALNIQIPLESYTEVTLVNQPILEKVKFQVTILK